jgi:hypothetical protein
MILNYFAAWLQQREALLTIQVGIIYNSCIVRDWFLVNFPTALKIVKMNEWNRTSWRTWWNTEIGKWGNTEMLYIHDEIFIHIIIKYKEENQTSET